MVVVPLLFFWIAVSLPNLQLITQVIHSESFTFVKKARFLWSMVESYTTNFNVLSQVVIVVTAALAGLNVALLAALIQNRARAVGSGIFSTGGGALAGILGIGCASCGSIILTSFLPLIGLSSLGFLPFGGAEFGIIGIAILAYATKRTIDHIQAPLVCIPKELM